MAGTNQQGTDVNESLAAQHDRARVEKRDETGALPPEKIEPDQVNRWAEALGISPEELRVAIQKAGPYVEDVKSHLGKVG